MVRAHYTHTNILYYTIYTSSLSHNFCCRALVTRLFNSSISNSLSLGLDSDSGRLVETRS